MVAEWCMPPAKPFNALDLPQIPSLWHTTISHPITQTHASSAPSTPPPTGLAGDSPFGKGQHQYPSRERFSEGPTALNCRFSSVRSPECQYQHAALVGALSKTKQRIHPKMQISACRVPWPTQSEDTPNSLASRFILPPVGFNADRLLACSPARLLAACQATLHPFAERSRQTCSRETRLKIVRS